MRGYSSPISGPGLHLNPSCVFHAEYSKESEAMLRGKLWNKPPEMVSLRSLSQAQERWRDKSRYSREEMQATHVILLCFALLEMPHNFPQKKNLSCGSYFSGHNFFIPRIATGLFWISEWQPLIFENATHGHHVMVEKEEMTLGCQSQYWPALECLFVLSGGCRELTKEKQSSSVSKHKLKMISFSASLVSTAHKPRAALGSRSVYGPAEP